MKEKENEEKPQIVEIEVTLKTKQPAKVPARGSGGGCVRRFLHVCWALCFAFIVLVTLIYCRPWWACMLGVGIEALFYLFIADTIEGLTRRLPPGESFSPLDLLK